jgi:fatty acid desaturase
MKKRMNNTQLWIFAAVFAIALLMRGNFPNFFPPFILVIFITLITFFFLLVHGSVTYRFQIDIGCKLGYSAACLLSDPYST